MWHKLCPIVVFVTNHQLVWQQSPAEFRNDVESSIKLLQDITGQLIECFRAPGFSIRESRDTGPCPLFLNKNPILLR